MTRNFMLLYKLQKNGDIICCQEFVLYSDNHALQFINNQPKLNQKNFIIKHTSDKLNKFVDALSRVKLIMQELQVGVGGFEEMVDMYKYDA